MVVAGDTVEAKAGHMTVESTEVVQEEVGCSEAVTS